MSNVCTTIQLLGSGGQFSVPVPAQGLDMHEKVGQAMQVDVPTSHLSPSLTLYHHLQTLAVVANTGSRCTNQRPRATEAVTHADSLPPHCCDCRSGLHAGACAPGAAGAGVVSSCTADAPSAASHGDPRGCAKDAEGRGRPAPAGGRTLACGRSSGGGSCGEQLPNDHHALHAREHSVLAGSYGYVRGRAANGGEARMV